MWVLCFCLECNTSLSKPIVASLILVLQTTQKDSIYGMGLNDAYTDGVSVVGEDHTHHGQAVLKGSIWEGVEVTRETFFKRNLLGLISVPEGTEHQYCHLPQCPFKVGTPGLSTKRCRADTILQPLGKPRTRRTYPPGPKTLPHNLHSINP